MAAAAAGLATTKEDVVAADAGRVAGRDNPASAAAIGFKWRELEGVKGTVGRS